MTFKLAETFEVVHQNDESDGLFSKELEKLCKKHNKELKFLTDYYYKVK